MSSRPYIDELKKDFDSYASIVKGSARYMSQMVRSCDHRDIDSSRLEIMAELATRDIELRDHELDILAHDLVEDIYRPWNY
ncbi:MAG: hypothetical protein ACLFTR_04125 [Candidatus Woesearchaeota archaeon]